MRYLKPTALGFDSTVSKSVACLAFRSDTLFNIVVLHEPPDHRR
jgi:hypothetical protein